MKKKQYYQYLKTEPWQSLRRAALLRFGNKCAQCKTKEFLQVHHLTYKRVGHEELTDLVVLCRDCHFGGHKKGKSFNRKLKNRFGIPSDKDYKHF